MRRKFMLAMLLACALPQAAPAQYLFSPGPRPPVLQAYQDDMRTVFAELFKPGVAAQAYIRPIDTPETAVGLRRAGDGYEIVALTPSRSIWTYQLIKLLKSGQMRQLGGGGPDPVALMRKGLPSKPKDLPLTRCTKPIDAQSGDEIMKTWRAMLTGQRSDRELARGVTYQFFLPDPAGERSGDAIAPDPATPAGRFAGLAFAMISHCYVGKGTADDLAKLARGVAG